MGRTSRRGNVTRILALVVCFGAGCGRSVEPATAKDAATAEQPSSPGLPSAGVRQLISQLIEQTEGSLAQAVYEDGAQEQAATFSLLGVDEQAGTIGHLAVPCVSSTLYAESCMSDRNYSPIRPGLDTCVRSGCAGANMLFSDVYITTLSHRSPDDRVAISYQTASPYPTGTVVYDPNPMTRWQVDASSADGAHVSSDVMQTVHASLDAEGPVDFSYTAQLDGSQASGRPYHLRMQLPGILTAGSLDVTLDNSDDMPKTGVITVGDSTVAVLDDDGVHWQ